MKSGAKNLRILIKTTISMSSIINHQSSIVNFIDLTTLEGKDNNTSIKALCRKAKDRRVAAVCVYPVFAELVSKELQQTGIKTACVAGAFPSAQSPLFIKISEVEYALQQGAQEIDAVISVGKFLEGDYQKVYDEIAAIKKACKEAHLKVILETGELLTAENITKAASIAIDAGADFIKTSTGKTAVSATLEASEVMLKVIKEYYKKSGKMIGFKAAGGISEPETALAYFNLVKCILGEKWLSPEYFRIGASRLVDRL